MLDLNSHWNISSSPCNKLAVVWCPKRHDSCDSDFLEQIVTDQSVGWVPQIAHPTSAAERWASYVLGACRSDRDPRTIRIWAREVAVSYSTLCESCRLVGVQPRCARDFARVLRVLAKPSSDICQLTSFLDVRDRRTLQAILQNAGFQCHAPILRQISVVSFLEQQQFIAHENAGLMIIREVFVARCPAKSVSVPFDRMVSRA